MTLAALGTLQLSRVRLNWVSVPGNIPKVLVVDVYTSRLGTKLG
jgi:hypothetical protein